jgi:hypothetical protein
LTGTFGGSLRNNGGSRSYPFTYSISTADTWEKKSVTVAGDTTGTWLTTTGRGLTIDFGLGTGSTYSGTAGVWAGAQYLSATGAVSVIGTLNATFYITGVQLEVGSVATEFERRPYGTELALCQRYYWKATKGSYPEVFHYYARTTTALAGSVSFPTTMRSTPSLELNTNGSANTVVRVDTAGTVSFTPAQAWWTQNGLAGVYNSSAVLVSGETYGFGIIASAEL